MFKIILKALLGTVVVTVGIGILTYGVVIGLEHLTPLFGHFAPPVMISSGAVVIMFSLFVSFFRFDAKRKAEEK